MKTIKQYFILLGLIAFFACSDDTEEVDDGGGILPSTVATASFASEHLTALATGGNISVPVSLTKAATEITKISVTTDTSAADAAREGRDFILQTSLISIAKGETQGNLQIGIPENPAASNKVIYLELSTVYGEGIGLGTKTKCQISLVAGAIVGFNGTPNDQGFILWEVKEDAGQFDIPITVTGELKEKTVVKFAVSENSTATSPEHYSLEKDSLVLEAGNQSGVLSVSLQHDPEVNPDRYLELEIVSVSGGNAIEAKEALKGKLKIQNVEIQKTLAFKDTKVTVGEKSGTAKITVKLDQPAEENVSFRITATDGTASSGTDYTLTQSDYTIVAGKDSVDVEVEIAYQDGIQNDRTFELQLGNASGDHVVLSRFGASCIVKISDYDIIKMASFAEQTYSVLENVKNKRLDVLLLLDRAAEEDITVNIGVAGGTAIKATHFNVPEQIVIKKWENTAYIPIEIIDDQEANDNRTVELQLTSATGGVTVSSEVCTVTIENDDVEVSFESPTYTIVENGKQLSVGVTLNRPALGALSVTIAARHITTQGTDIRIGTKTIDIPVGGTKGEFIVDILDNQMTDRQRQFEIGITNVSGSGIVSPSRNKTTVTIQSFYTSLLGEWKQSGGNDGTVILSEKEFGKSILCERNYGGFACSWTFDYNAKDRTLTILHGQKFHNNIINFDIGPRYAILEGDKQTTPVLCPFSKDYKTITIGTMRTQLYTEGMERTDRLWFEWKGVSLKKD